MLAPAVLTPLTPMMRTSGMATGVVVSCSYEVSLYLISVLRLGDHWLLSVPAQTFSVRICA